jgi:alkylation response protein AidB-like acyl-CoA dehydrogenase
VLTRTGTPDSRHRGLTALIVDLRTPGVEVRAVKQANGTEELAEVTFDDAFVPADRIVGEVGGGWAIAMHILSHERGTFAWFRHAFLYTAIRGSLPLASPSDDVQLGNGLLDLAAVTAAGIAAVEAHSRREPLGPKAAFTKLLLCNAEQSVNDWILATDPELALELEDDELAARRQEYLFSRIVTVYGGSQQMQLETIAKQTLRLP